MSGEAAPPRVLVAHEAEAIPTIAASLLEEAGYAAVSTGDGAQAVELALQHRPGVLVLDVALPQVLGYEVIERVRAGGLDARFLLIASVYSRTSYKRSPTSLHGAHDYVEQHHIPDQLIPKVARLLGEKAAPPTVTPETGETIRKAGEGRLRMRFTSPKDAEERATRLARLIVSDIALYNGDAMEKSVDSGVVDERLRLDLEEGRLLFDLRVPPEARQGRDFVGEALEAFFRERRVGGRSG